MNPGQPGQNNWAAEICQEIGHKAQNRVNRVGLTGVTELFIEWNSGIS